MLALHGCACPEEELPDESADVLVSDDLIEAEDGGPDVAPDTGELDVLADDVLEEDASEVDDSSDGTEEVEVKPPDVAVVDEDAGGRDEEVDESDTADAEDTFEPACPPAEEEIVAVAPWMEDWDLVEAPCGIFDAGWAVASATGEPEMSTLWLLAADSTDGLGPDPHVVLGDVETLACLITPPIDSTGPSNAPASANLWMTAQFEAMADSGLTVLGCADCELPAGGDGLDPAWAPLSTVAWGDGLVTIDLSGSDAVLAQNFRLAFCGGLDGPVGLDRVAVARERPPEWGGPGWETIIDAPIDGPPATLSLSIGTTKQLDVQAHKDDVQKAPFLAFLEFHIDEAPPGVTWQSEQVGWDFTAETFKRTLVFDATGEDLTVGTHTVRLRVSDGFFEARHTLTLTVTPDEP